MDKIYELWYTTKLYYIFEFKSKDDVKQFSSQNGWNILDIL